MNVIIKRSFLATHFLWIAFLLQAPFAQAGTSSLIARYTFDNGIVNATDSSGNGNTLYSFGSVALTTDALEGAYAEEFTTNNIGLGYGLLSSTVNNSLTAALEGSFSISLWLKTTQVSGSSTDSGLFNNAGIVSAFNASYTNYTVPMVITGDKLAFVTGNSLTALNAIYGIGIETLYSASSINLNQYVHVVVTRDQPTGAKNIYFNGSLDATGSGTTNLLTDSIQFFLGIQNGNGFNGELDDIQIYSRALSAGEVSELYGNPGTVITNATAPVFVTLSAAPVAGTNATIQLSFQTVSGISQTMQATTNLFTGNWVNLTNIVGDGTVQQFYFSTKNSYAGYFRVISP